jgi:hypothetical protein
MNLSGASEPTVRKALRGESCTKKAFKIRKLAMELGGIEVMRNAEKSIVNN